MNAEPFYTVGHNMPGCLPDTDEPLPVFGSLQDARDALVDEIRFSQSIDEEAEASNFDEGSAEQAEAWERDAEWNEAAEQASRADGPTTIYGPDGRAYWLDIAEPKGTFLVGAPEPTSHPDDGTRQVVVSLLASSESEAEPIVDDVGSIDGNMLERDGCCVYTIVDADRVDAAAAELRDQGYALEREG